MASSMLARTLCAAAVVSQTTATKPSESDLEDMYEKFQERYNRQENDLSRFAAFKKNVVSAIEMNAEQGAVCTDLFDGDDCVFGITTFADMFQDEFEATHLGYKPSSEPSDAPILSFNATQNAAASVDWRTKGAVTPVKDQGQCGSCWAFSTTETVESQVFMKTGKLPVLSTQQIISCDTVDAGCNGGNTETGYKYIEKAGGLDTAADYPDKSHTTAKTGKCTWDKKKVAKVSGYTYATKPCTSGACKKQDEDALAAAVAAKGPVSICVNAGGSGWQNYKKGVFTKKCSPAASDIDHCVQVVGYNKAGSTPYWIVRNSWASSWGIDGYMHLEMGKNLCGIADDATIPEVAAADVGIVTV